MAEKDQQPDTAREEPAEIEGTPADREPAELDDSSTIHLDARRVRQVTILLLALAISVLFVAMIRNFLVTMVLAAIFAALTRPLYLRLLPKVGRRRGVASALSLLIVLLVVILPLLGLLGLVANEAYHISQTIGPDIQKEILEPGLLDRVVSHAPFLKTLAPYREQLMEKLGEAATVTGKFLVQQLSSTTRGTVGFLFHLFIMLYAMFFFLIDGPAYVSSLMSLLPIGSKDKTRLLDKFVSVTRATLKGTVVIGVVQGTLAGAAFAVVGISGSLFWGTLMAVLSLIPAVGTPLVWVPAVIYLAAQGKFAAALGLTLWCALVVGSVDNLLRPRLVGGDTQMPDLMILLSTLGGLVFFGVVGFIIGPIVAALFLTTWSIYRSTFGSLIDEAEALVESPEPG